MSLTIISYGGGVQSTAMLVLACEGRLGYDVDAAVFANVGPNSEHPATLTFIEEVARPYCAEHGLELVEVRRTMVRSGEVKDLYDDLMDPEMKAVKIPVRLGTGAPGNRICTVDYKVKPMARWLKQNGASKTDPATVLIGFSTDEVFRVGRGQPIPGQERAYPLIDLGLSRSACQQLIADAGLPVPPKSSCYFCPFRTKQVWAEMRRDEPELFQKTVELERAMINKRHALGRDPAYLHGDLKPLDEAVHEAQDMLPLFDDKDGECDSGMCWT